MTIAVPQAPAGYWFTDAGVQQAYKESANRYEPMYPRIFGPIPVDGANGEFLRFSAGQYMRRATTDISVNGGSNIDTFDFQIDNWRLGWRKLEIPVPFRVGALMSRAGVDAVSEAALMAANRVAVETDQAMLGFIVPASFPLGGTTGLDATATPWSNPATDLIGQFAAAHIGLNTRGGKMRRVGFGNYVHQQWLSLNSGIRQSLSVQRDMPGVIQGPDLALALGLDEMVFFDHSIITSPMGVAAETFAPAWPTSQFFVATVATGGSISTPGVGRAPYWTHPYGGAQGTNQLFVDAKDESTTARTINAVGFKIMDTRFGYLFGNIA